jgi:transposase
VDRETVARYLRLRAKPAISITGSDDGGWLQLKPAIWITGKGAGRKSQYEPLAEVISAKIEGGLSAQRIYQDLVVEKGFIDSYQSVRRFVCKLRARQPERVWRVEVQPGEEVQVDFGVGAPIEYFGCWWLARSGVEFVPLLDQSRIRIGRGFKKRLLKKLHFC